MSSPSIAPGTFDHAPEFDAGETHGGIHLGKYEAMYEEIFAEVIEDGVITVEERQRLDRAADAMGLDKHRLRQLEAALQSAWEAHHHTRIVHQDDELPPQSIVIPAAPKTPSAIPSTVPDRPDAVLVTALKQQISMLQMRIRDLEKEVERARNDVAVEVDLGAVTSPATVDDPTDLQRRIRQDPTDAEPMRLLFRWAKEENRLDEQWCVASALALIGRANAEEQAIFEKHRGRELPKPTAALSSEAWRTLLFHPDEELLVGDVFAVITSAVLLGRVSVLRRDKQLPKLDAEKRQDPTMSTIAAVRALGWSAAILGLRPPPIFVDPERPISIEMIPGVPPNLRVGGKLLSGRTPLEVAFECGRALAGFREEHFVRSLFPGIPDLEDLFLAALSIANPALPIPGHARARAVPIAAAIQPVLEPSQIDRLRGHYLHFVEEGGRTNLQRWAHGVDRTTCRAGLLLCNDLATAGKILHDEEKAPEGTIGPRARDLIVFACSDRYFRLRKQLGIAITRG